MTRFSLRDMFWVTLVVGMGLGWYAHYLQKNASLRKAKHDNRELFHRYEKFIWAQFE